MWPSVDGAADDQDAGLEVQVADPQLSQLPPSQPALDVGLDEQLRVGHRQLKDPHVVSFSPMHHWTEHNIRIHVFTCVLALQIAHLMRRKARQAGLDLSVRALLDALAGIEETVLIYPSTGGRPRARRMTTELSADQRRLHEIFGLDRWAPRS